MNATVLNFSIKLIVVLVFAFGLHLLVLNYLEQPLFENKIILAYISNVLMAIFIFWMLHKFKEKYKEQLGFLFIAGSFLKFIVFFALFYGSYKSDGSISKLEFAAFFVPYALCLMMETYSLSKWLNKMQ